MSRRFWQLPFIIFLSFFVFASPANAQYIGNCPDADEIKKDANGWRDSQPEFQKVPPDVPAFYDPYLNKNFPKNTHIDTTMLPNKNNLACLIAYAKEEWHDLYGTEFDQQGVEKVINFAVANNYNPSFLLALWAEETHGGDMGDRQLGCGNAYGLDAQLKCLASIDPKYKLNTFACFLGSYAGDTPLSLNCGYGDPDGIVTNPFFPYIIQYYNYLIRGVKSTLSTTTTSASSSFKFHPLRPFPDKPAPAAPPLTPYCAMRPTPVQLNRFDVREPLIDIKTVGTLTQDFTKFVTPLLSITDPKKVDYQLPYSQKAQRYMADFLEGRAYYEPFPEPTNPSASQTQDLFNRLGVFRKLAPKTYQDELKRAMIQRAAGSFSNTVNNPYGFNAASLKIHNYVVGNWDNSLKKVVGQKQGQPVTLNDYYANGAWAPLPQDYSVDAGATYTADTPTYAMDYADWKVKDGGKWYQLWPYVPMFTREDTTGRIDIIDSNSPPNDPPFFPGDSYIEINNTQNKSVDVVHPHLARTYEVSSSLNLLLNPAEVPKPPVVPIMGEEWFPKLWEGPIWWLDPSLEKPHIKFTPPLQFGPLCDVDPDLIKPIRSSGDLAFDSIISTAVNRQDLNVVNPQYNPSQITEKCVNRLGITVNKTHYTCEKLNPDCSIDESGCYYYKQIRSNPNYLISYTPFLNEITANLISTQSGIFNLFRPSGAGQKPYEEYDWPGLGNEGEDSPQYDFTAGDPSHAEAGARKPGGTQSYYYRYLGSLQCAKERVLQVLQPFITGSPYEPYAPECFGLPPKSGTASGATGSSLGGSGSGSNFPNGQPILTGIAGTCPGGGQEITDKLAAAIPGGIVRLLPNSNGARKAHICIKPTMIIMHWSDGHDNTDGNERTYETLIQRDLACQLATDPDDVYLMQPFYETQVEMPWCTGNYKWNLVSINTEMAGTNFTSPPPPPSAENLNNAIAATCTIMKQYGIPWTQIFGHYQVDGMQGIKEDPGEEFLQEVFIPKVKQKCGQIVNQPI